MRRLIYARTAITLLLGRIPTAVPVPLARMQPLFTHVHFPPPRASNFRRDFYYKPNF